jgi:copper(I)-binding protein
MNVRVATICLALAASACSRASSPSSPHLRIEEPIVLRVPSGAAALYARVVNEGDSPDRLDGVNSSMASAAELHETVRAGTFVSMSPVPGGFLVAPHGTLSLERSGKHVMLFGVAREGGTMPVSLHFVASGTIDVQAPVRSALP